MQALRQQTLAGTLAALLLFAPTQVVPAQRTPLKPGWNIFSPRQDVQIGHEVSAEAERELPLLGNPRVDAYLNVLGQRLAAYVPGHKFPYQFKGVNDAAINAFALPGGVIYINRGLIEAADNEAQLAGVVAHEISHVALRHGTNQLTKALAWRAPLMLLGGLIGDSGSLTGQLAQLGLAVGFTAIFLKYSRTAESQADVLATQLLFDAGYEPRQMAAFFEKIERGEGSSGVVEFFSDHPNPGNRVKRVEEEIARLGGRSGPKKDSGDFQLIRSYLKGLPQPRNQSTDKSINQ